MHSKCSQPPVVISLQGMALSMYDAAKQAITVFLAETKVPPCFRTKLVFFHSDMMRDPHKVFRAAQFLRTLCPNLPHDERVAMSLDEFTVALHKWIRQVQWHFGSYRFAAHKKDELAAGLSNKAMDSKHILCGVPETEEQEPLDTDSLFLLALIVKSPNDWPTIRGFFSIILCTWWVKLIPPKWMWAHVLKSFLQLRRWTENLFLIPEV